MPEIETTLDNKSGVANISWTSPISNEDLNYYDISVNDSPPMQTRNTSILYNTGNAERFLNSISLSLRATAVDRCGQQGGTAKNITLVVVASSDNELFPHIMELRKVRTN